VSKAIHRRCFNSIEYDGKINIDIRQDLNIFSLGDEVKEYQQNYLEHISRMPTNRNPGKLFDCHPKGSREKDRPPKRWKNILF
jgi:hypothetical protein